MIKNNLGLWALVTALSLGLSGCKEEEKEKRYQRLSGRPLSAVLEYKDHSGALVIVLERFEDSKKVLAYSEAPHEGLLLPYTKAVALVQSEIVDGDNDVIDLVGEYEGYVEGEGGISRKFKIKSVKANGYTTDF